MGKNRQKKKARQRKRREELLASEVDEKEQEPIIVKNLVDEDGVDLSEDEELVVKEIVEEEEEREEFIKKEWLEKSEEEKSHLIEVSVGPTSFEELDVAEEAREKIREADNVLWDAREITSNILRSGEGAEEIGSKLQALGNDIKGRLSNVLGETKEFDIDIQLEIFEIKSLLKEMGWTEKVFDPKKRIIHRNLTSLLKQVREGDESRETDFTLATVRKAGIGQPGKNNSNNIVIFKDSKGEQRFLGWVSNNFEDRENQIIESKAHEEFIEHLNQNPHLAPEFRVWHVQGSARKSRVDWWSFTNGFLLMSGKLTKQEALKLYQAKEKHDLGMSHGFFVLEPEEINPPVITKYRTFEVSDLPRKFAANYWTAISALNKEALMTDLKKNVNQQEFLLEMTSQEFVDDILANTSEASANLADLGVESKEIEEEVEEKEETKEEDSGEEALPELEELIKTLGLDILSTRYEAMEKDMAEIKEILAKALPVLAKELDELKKSDDEKVAEQFVAPVANQLAWLKDRPSAKDDNVADENTDKELLGVIDEGNEDNWFLKAHNAESVPVEQS